MNLSDLTIFERIYLGAYLFPVAFGVPALAICAIGIVLLIREMLKEDDRL